VTFALPTPVVADDGQQRNNVALATEVNALSGRVVAGTGAPAHTPAGPQLYLRLDGGAGSTLYVYEPGSGWAAK
jgi:hypothetical protein